MRKKNTGDVSHDKKQTLVCKRQVVENVDTEMIRQSVLVKGDVKNDDSVSERSWKELG